MRKPVFWIVYILLALVQLVFSNYVTITPYVMVSVLPVMVLCIPTRIGTTGTMFIALVTGLAVDLLSDGVLGLNALALVPVAFGRNSVIRLIFGEELFARKEDFSVNRAGMGKVVLAIILTQVLFLVIYIWADGAGTRPFWFNAARFGASLVAGTIASLLIVDTLAPDSRR